MLKVFEIVMFIITFLVTIVDYKKGNKVIFDILLLISILLMILS